MLAVSHELTRRASLRAWLSPARRGGRSPDGPAMDVRAWDLKTGKLLWTFHTLPHPGETGYESWPKDNWISGGSPANWGAMTIDTQRGLAFLPIGQPASQYYGGAREGNNLFSSSIVCLDLNTGKMKWYFQLTHHDMWDYDAEAAPALIDVVPAGRKFPQWSRSRRFR